MSHRLPVARAMAARGYEVHVAAPADHVWAPSDFDVAALEALGIRFHPIPLDRRGTSPVTELGTFFAILRLYRGLRPRLVHHLTIKPVLYGGIAARLAGVPAMVSAVTGLGHVFTGRGLLLRLLRPLVLWGYRVATRHPNARIVVQNTEDARELVRLRAIPEGRVVLIRGSGVSLDTFPAVPEPAGIPLVVLPARLIWDKGIAEFVEAARRLKAEGVACRFALVGNTHPSNPRAVPAAQLCTWQREGVIEWWGRREDMPQVFAEAHVVCMPSTYGEGIPKVLIEAASSARPIVTTSIAGCREIVREGENGLLVPPGDVAALTAALRRLLLDPALRQRMGGSGRAIVQESFSEELVVARTLAVYDELLAAAAPA